MHKYLSLTRTLLKTGISFTDVKSRKLYRIFLSIILLLSIMPTLFGIYILIDTALPFYNQIDQSASLMGTVLFIICSTIFMFSLFIVPSIFYFSNDVDLLLALPLKGDHIIAAKFTVSVIYEYSLVFAILIPATAAYIHVCGFSLSLCLFALLCALLLPIFPLVISTVLTILIMRFMPFFKNKDHFHFISGILLVAVGIALSVMLNSVQIGNQEALLNMLLSGNNSLLNVFMKLFPMIPYFARAIVQGSVIDLMIGIGICALALFVLLMLGRMWYFKGAIGNSEASVKRKKQNHYIQKEMKQTNKTLAYLKKEWRMILRTPAFATNCIGSALIFPFLLFFMTMFSQDQKMLLSLINTLQNDSDFIYYVAIFGLGFGLFIGCVNMVSVTALSREGSAYIVMKYLPFSYHKQIHVKMLLGILLGITTDLLTVIALMISLSFDWYYYVLLFLCMCISTVFSNEVCIIIDMYKPKLIWEQEASAIKQNFSSFLATMIMLGLCVLIIMLCFIIPSEYLFLTTCASVILCIIADIAGYRLSGHFAQSALSKL